MSASELARFFARVALDDELRAIAVTDVARAAEGYALEPRHLEALRRGGPELLDLLGEAYRAGEASSPAGEASSPAAGAAATEPERRGGDADVARRLPAIGLTLRLQPFATGAGADLQLRWAASLIPDGAPEPVIDPTPPGTALPPLRLRIGVTPLTELADEGLRLRFATEVQPEGTFEATSAPPAAGERPLRYNPWDHRLDTPEVREAAAAVRAASPAERHTRVLALIRAMETR